MKLISERVSVQSYMVVAIAFAIFAAIFSALFFLIDAAQYPKQSTFYGGLAGAFIVALVQLSITIYESLKLSHYEKMGVLRLLPDPTRYQILCKLDKKCR
jgi:uncharacterized membrane protein YagU involved in acid resistance